jgi:hypothetical protein
VALTTPDGPFIVPNNYSVIDDAIVMRTSPESVLGTYGPTTTLAFEVDQVDYERHHAWSVLARGPARVLAPGEELDRVRRLWDPHPWAAGDRPLYLALTWHELTGRKIGAGWDPFAERPAHREL